MWRERVQEYIDLRLLVSVFPNFLEALWLTVLVAVLSLFGAFVVALVILVPRMSSSRIVSSPVVIYVEFMRNTPLILQLYLLYFALPMMGVRLSAVACGVIAITAQHAAFLVEIFRAGIESISLRQQEAAKALGMLRIQRMRYVVLPQALMNVIAPINNQFVTLIKDTSLVSAVGVMELTLTGKILMESRAAPFEIFLIVAFFYLALTAGFSGSLRAFESLYRGRQ